MARRRLKPVIAARDKELERLERALAEAHEYQAATSEVLSIISRSPADAQPVFEAIAESAGRLCKSIFSNIQLFDGENLRSAAAKNFSSEARKFMKLRSGPPGRWSIIGRAILDRDIVQIPDVREDPEYSPEYAAKGGWRGALAVPIMRDGKPLGAIAVGKAEPGLYTDRQVRLLKIFADQAVIAIENVRLFDEVQARTEELSEALEQQTATAEILTVISNSLSDTQPVFDAIVNSGKKLFPDAAITIVIPRGDQMHAVAVAARDRKSETAVRQVFPIPLTREYLHGSAILDRCMIDIPDVEEAPKELTAGAQNALAGGNRAVTAVPLMRGGEAIGALSVVRRKLGPLTDKQLSILKTFADQAVIAIENTRLLKELRESLQQQTATAEVLKVISRSAFDVKKVFEAVAESAVRLCEAERAFVFRYDGELLHSVVSINASQELIEFVRNNPMRPGRHSCTARTALERQVVQIEDVAADPEYSYGAREVDPMHTNLGVPILKGDELLGVITIYRLEVKPFTANQIALLETFADQAAIAVENAELFTQVQARNAELDEALQQQTATSDVLKAISRSTFDLATVLNTLVEAAARLSEADQGTIAREAAGQFRRVASYGYSEEFNAAIASLPVELERGSATGRALVEGRIVHISDVQSDPEYTFAEAKKLGGFRTALAVPMLREGVAIGVLVLTRKQAKPFTDKQIELVCTFADQAAIAIENVRLFESAEARSRELAASLEELRTAQDRLVQTEKLASLGQLTAGIAHEIKNPLNFVNNFSSVSAELIDELGEALAGLKLEGEAREEVGELAEMLKGNLEKIVQHGKRADSIVKNMLLHARQGSAEHRPVDVNALVEESLNLAYHGARAERQGFNITLERAFDPNAGEADLYPQDITRVLLNLISNGFYATMKRKQQPDADGYEPTVTATTHDLGDSVELRIRDNGTGIPPEVREKLFSPFFTTKPVGEGTGLGLSISHDVVVKQHGGTLEVDSRPGEFTEFRVTLPRASLAPAGGTHQA